MKNNILLNRKGGRGMEKLTRVEFFKMKVSKNMFWALNKHPEQLYGVVLPSVIG